MLLLFTLLGVVWSLNLLQLPSKQWFFYILKFRVAEWRLVDMEINRSEAVVFRFVDLVIRGPTGK